MVSTIDEARTPAELAEWLRVWADGYEEGVDYLDDNDARQLAEAVERVCAPCNAAALREALEQALAYCESDQKSGIAYSDNDILVPMLRAALSAPARNCDVSRDTKQTIERCLADLNVESSSASFDAGVCAAIGWMLAAPAKGGAE